MIKAKEKKERALGTRLHLKGERCDSPKCALVRKPYRPGIHGPKKSRRNISEFGRQINEKQKFKLTYGVKEKNLRRIFEQAKKKVGSTADQLVELTERRLDNIVFRLGFAPSRASARQRVAHGHILVNGKKIKSPGYLIKKGDRIGIREESKKDKHFSDLRDKLKKHQLPAWLFLDEEKLEGRIEEMPSQEDSSFEINLLVESFSK